MSTPKKENMLNLNTLFITVAIGLSSWNLKKTMETGEKVAGNVEILNSIKEEQTVNKVWKLDVDLRLRNMDVEIEKLRIKTSGPR